MPILIKDKGNLIPNNWLEAAAKFEQKAWGVAALKSDGKIDTISDGVTKPEEALSSSEWKANQEDLKDAIVLYCLDGTANTILEEDRQPFTLLAKDNTTFLVGMFDGDFANFAMPGSSHTPAYNAVTNFLRPKIERLFKKCGGTSVDMPKLYAELQDEDFKNDILNICYPANTVVLLSTAGEPIVLTKNVGAMKTPFGFSTHTFGVKEGSFPAKEEAKAPDKPLTAKEKLAALKAAKATGTEKPAADPAVVQPTVTPTPGEPSKPDEKKTMADAVSTMTGTLVWVTPDPKMSNNKAQTWYFKHRAAMGLPRLDIKGSARPPLQVPLDYYNTKMKASGARIVNENGTTYKEFVKPEEPGTLIGDKLKEAEKKNIEPDHVKTSNTLEVMPRLGPDSLKFLKEGLKLQAPVSDEVLQGLEKKYSSYFEVGHPWSDVRSWSYANFLDVAQDPHAVALLAFTLAAKMRNVEAVLPSTIRTQEKKVA